MRPYPTIEYQQHEHLYVPREVSNGRRLVIVGEAERGEYYEPVHIYRLDMAESHFGSGPLVERFKDIESLGMQVDVYLTRISPRAFQAALEYLRPFTFDLIFFDNFKFGTSTMDVEAFIDFAIEKEEKGTLIHGFFELEEFTTFSNLNPVIDYIESLTIEDMNGVYELGKYFSVIVRQFNTKSTGAMYAGMVNSLEPGTSPINKPINAELAFELTKEQILKLQQAGIVCFKNSFKLGTVCASSTCAVSTTGSPHKQIANFRIVQFVIKEITERVQSFIGMAGVNFHINEIMQIVGEILSRYNGDGIIKEYAYGVLAEQANVNGVVLLEIEIVPIFTTAKMISHSQVRVFK